MTLLEAKHLPLPIPSDFTHAKPTYDEIWPAHWNDVRFNFRPENIDRRCFIHDNMMNLYNFEHDFAHTTGYVDEDLDWEQPDPYDSNHFKKKRSGAVMFIGAFVALAGLYLLPTCGFKIPQKDNPFYYRKKYASSTSIQQFQKHALTEYGAAVPKYPDSNVMITQKGFVHQGNGLRFELDNYNDLVC